MSAVTARDTRRPEGRHVEGGVKLRRVPTRRRMVAISDPDPQVYDELVRLDLR